MAVVDILPSDERVIEFLEENGVVRRCELIEEVYPVPDSISVRRQLDELEVGDEIRRLVVGDHIMYRRLEDTTE